MNIRQTNITRISNNLSGSNVPKSRKKEKVVFKEVLDSVEKSKLKFSGHALRRIEKRSIEFNDDELSRIENAIVKAGRKGVKDAVILMDNKVLITNIPTRTIITTFNREDMKENVFTNIDGAIIA